ncbi:3-oxoacyl-[acyl-carrier-protein] reductase [Cesiribacter andamanensis]|uniref:3-oxoacyl-[acyl-carrier-protein] reductase n=1 Tax=Cesiribacter andamanensis AMV16 TaxID=1279009 RepID=M7NUE8_9BACT|nr:3-oxoacyl-[acyl-carrier-protein] reductase [Cesiribacter andamanensis]EMR02114.1 3-oxoacyl-[acyl-carrier-protein] reductase FabG [Cesiribacter andamanensis AMV16]
MKRLENKIAIITGGASGIGKVTAQRFAQEGATVIIWDLAEERGRETAHELEAQGYPARFMRVNTARYEEVEQAAREVADRWGRIDILINNAGITRDASLKKMTPEQWQQVLDVNLTGVFNCTKILSEYMVNGGWGRIISASSVVGLYGNFGQTNYVATKAGVIGMTRVWARELGRKGVTANAVAPGFIATEMTRQIPEEVRRQIEAKIPMGSMGDPLDIANAYVFLASDEARYINGAVLSVDGGMVG